MDRNHKLMKEGWKEGRRLKSKLKSGNAWGHTLTVLQKTNKQTKRVVRMGVEKTKIEDSSTGADKGTEGLDICKS